MAMGDDVIEQIQQATRDAIGLTPSREECERALAAWVVGNVPGWDRMLDVRATISDDGATVSGTAPGRVDAIEVTVALLEAKP